MKHLASLLVLSLLFVFPCALIAQDVSVSVLGNKGAIHIPDILGYETLVCDFHMHTVFSDGNVWPPIRVMEAGREGLDAIAITDHIEYQPKKDDIPTNFERSHELSESSAKSANVLLPLAAEITRDTPPGHYNAVFLKDIEPLDTDEFMDVIEAANEQDAFVFWNHPGWKGEERGQWRDFHDTMIENKWLHGIEICNGGSYYEYAHQHAIDNNLTLLGNTDIHGIAYFGTKLGEEHRTSTLVFAKDKSLKALKEALFAGRTAVWYKDRIIGKEEYLKELFYSSIRISAPHHSYHSKKYTYCLEIENNSVFQFDIERMDVKNAKPLTLEANSTSILTVVSDEELKRIQLPCRIANFITAPQKPLTVNLVFNIQ